MPKYKEIVNKKNKNIIFKPTVDKISQKKFIFRDKNNKNFNKKNYNFYKFLLYKFINLLMLSGKKFRSEKIFFNILKFLSLKSKKFPFLIFITALKNISPLVIVKSIKIRGRSYQVPIPLKKLQQIFLGMKWLIKLCRIKKFSKNNFFVNNLIEQIFLALEKQGELIKKKHELHKFAKINRIYASYRWF